MQLEAEAPADSGWSIRELLSPEPFPHRVSQVLLRETPLSWIVLTGDYAYKIKRPVRREFIDASTVSARHALCIEELRLNQRLAADIYCEVLAVRRTSTGLKLGGSDGEVVDYAVKMRQFSADDELSSLLDRRRVTAEQIAELGQALADFHAHAAHSACSNYPEQIREQVLGNLATLLAHLGDTADAPAIDHLIDWLHDFLHDRRATFEGRQQGGFIREGHGDLHARNVVLWRGVLTPFDCLEFDPKLRFIDTLDDAAFLVMDLLSYKRRDLACAFLNRYGECTGDYRGLALLPFYGVHRALVRAMVDAYTLEAGGGADIVSRLRKRVAVADELSEPPSPALILMHGVSGSGKSYISEKLVPRLPGLRIRSDRERKRLAAAHALPGSDPYSAESSRMVYESLLNSAHAILESGFNAIVDATFLRSADRTPFANLARNQGAAFIIIDCQASPEVLKSRVEQRARGGDDPSDADAAILKQQLEQQLPLSSEEQHYALPFTADTDAERLVQQLQERIIRPGL